MGGFKIIYKKVILNEGGRFMLRMFLMREAVQTFVYAFLYSLCICLPIAGLIMLTSFLLKGMLLIFFFILALSCIHLFPKRTFERKHLTILYSGYRSLEIFMASCLIIFVVGITPLLCVAFSWQNLVISFAWIVLLEAILFWNGMTRVFLSSVQLGIKMRMIAAFCGWIPLLNIYMLLRVISIIEKELTFEYEKDLLDDVQVESLKCLTNYPIVLVHGVFFRDIKYLNYWGRIPRFLKQRGAEIYYGNQESAQSVEYCGQQLAANIKEIVQQTNCKKVNIIAHSKGGLDSRYAISNCGLDEYVVSLTTINTPHNGCIFANYLLKKAPKKLVNQVEKMYNGTFKKFGDKNPDFLLSVNNLSDEACRELNMKMPNKEGVYYQGVTSYVGTATSGKFPLNISYPIVKHFDGRNDGLVSVESASYFKNTVVVTPKGRRGISHADMIDLNRENIDGFDVRQFYQELIMDLKNQGF